MALAARPAAGPAAPIGKAIGGTWTVDEAARTIAVAITGSTYANLLGAPQPRLITALDAEVLRFDNPRTPSGLVLRTAWRRAPPAR